MRENVKSGVFLNIRKVGLNWSLEVAFANYKSFWPTTTFLKVQVHSTRLEIELALKNKRHM